MKLLPAFIALAIALSFAACNRSASCIKCTTHLYRNDSTGGASDLPSTYTYCELTQEERDRLTAKADTMFTSPSHLYFTYSESTCE